MRCPVCGYDNLTGADSLRQLRRGPPGPDIPQPTLSFHGRLLGEHLDELGAPAPFTVDPDAPVAEAIARMHADGIDCVLVDRRRARCVGIFTDHDAVVKAAGKPLDSATVGDLMTPDPVVLRHDDPIALAINKMAVGGFRHIPIAQDGSRPVSSPPGTSSTTSRRSWADRADRHPGRRPHLVDSSGRSRSWLRCARPRSVRSLAALEGVLADVDGVLVDLTALAYDGVAASPWLTRPRIRSSRSGSTTTSSCADGLWLPARRASIPTAGVRGRTARHRRWLTEMAPREPVATVRPADESPHRRTRRSLPIDIGNGSPPRRRSWRGRARGDPRRRRRRPAVSDRLSGDAARAAHDARHPGARGVALVVPRLEAAARRLSPPAAAGDLAGGHLGGGRGPHASSPRWSPPPARVRPPPSARSRSPTTCRRGICFGWPIPGVLGWSSPRPFCATLRIVKDRDEIALLRQAAHAADRVVAQIAAGRLVGRTEADVAHEVRERLIAEGHDDGRLRDRRLRPELGVAAPRGVRPGHRRPASRSSSTSAARSAATAPTSPGRCG